MGIKKPDSSFSTSAKPGIWRIGTKVGQVPQMRTDIAGRFLSKDSVSRTLNQVFFRKLVVYYPSYSFQMMVVTHETKQTRKRADLDIYFEESISSYFPITTMRSLFACIICV